MKSRTRQFLAAMCVCGAAAVNHDARADMPVSGRGFFGIGHMRLDTKDISDRLQANGYAGVNEGFLMAGGGGYALFDNGLLVGGSGFGLVSSEKQVSRNGAHYEQSFNAGYGAFRVGYALLRTEDFHLAPYGGLGGGGASLEVRKTGEASFDAALANPDRNLAMAKGGVIVDVGIGVNHLVGPVSDDESRGGFAVGAEVGYLWMPSKAGKWTIDDNDVSGGPEFALQGFYFRLTLGGGADPLPPEESHEPAPPPPQSDTPPQEEARPQEDAEQTTKPLQDPQG